MASSDDYVSTSYKDINTANYHRSNIERSLRIFPNPSSGVFNIDISEYSGQIKYEVFNTMGALVETGYLDSTILVINLEKSPKGTYILKLTSGADVHTRLLISN